MDQFDFDDQLEPKTKTVRMKGVVYLLVEASEDASIKYLDAVAKAVTIQDGKVVNVAPHHQVDSQLVADCCLMVDPATGKPQLDKGGHVMTVPVGVVRKWSHAHIQAMAEWVKTVSELDRKKKPDTTPEEAKKTEEEALKNEPVAGESTSD